MRLCRYPARAALAALAPLLIGTSAAEGQEQPISGHEHHAVSAPPDSLPPQAAARRLAPGRPPTVLEVGPGRVIETIEAAMARSVDGDTILVHTGVYDERVTISTAVTVLGLGEPVIDGGGQGTVVTVDAPAEIRGFTIRGSGADQSHEDAGILVRAADSVRIVDNRITDVLFGVYIKQSRESVVRDNLIEGKDLPIPRRGDGVRLWYCAGGVVEGNRLWRTRDLVIWFTQGLEIRRNLVTHGRYGLHYMYSDQNVFVDNVFAHNDVGAFLMYSKGIQLRGNRFERATGASGIGLGLKDSDDIVAEDNTVVGNAIGIFLDNSPSAVGGRNAFRGNLVAANDAGLVMLPAVHSNDFTANAFIGNETPVVVSGGGDGMANEWTGNHWSEYAGFDEDGDGTGDTPFLHSRLADDLFSRHPDLRFLAGSPAVSALEILARLFPLLAPRPVVIDSLPVVDEPAFAVAGLSAANGLNERMPAGSHAAAAIMWAASLLAAIVLVRLTRRPA